MKASASLQRVFAAEPAGAHPRTLVSIEGARSGAALDSPWPRAVVRLPRVPPALENACDAQLVEQARRGDKRAFEQLVVRYQKRAFGVAVGLVRNEQDAQEIVQEAFLRVYRGLAEFSGGCSFFTWLYRIVRNLAIDLIRRPSRREQEQLELQISSEEQIFPLFGQFDAADPWNALWRTEIGARLQAALEQLPPYHRGVIVMREVEGLSYEEMAQAMGVSKGTIMSRLFHARRKLQSALADLYNGELGLGMPV